VAPTEAIMIGDNLLTDIAGAGNANIDTVFFNPNKIQHSKNINYEIKTLSELTKLSVISILLPLSPNLGKLESI